MPRKSLTDTAKIVGIVVIGEFYQNGRSFCTVEFTEIFCRNGFDFRGNGINFFEIVGENIGGTFSLNAVGVVIDL